MINQSPAVPPVLTHILCPLYTYYHTQTVVNEVPAPSHLLQFRLALKSPFGFPLTYRHSTTGDSLKSGKKLTYSFSSVFLTLPHKNQFVNSFFKIFSYDLRQSQAINIFYWLFQNLYQQSGLINALFHHGLCYFFKACDICTGNKIVSETVFFCGGNGILVNINHSMMKFFVNLFGCP